MALAPGSQGGGSSEMKDYEAAAKDVVEQVIVNEAAKPNTLLTIRDGALVAQALATLALVEEIRQLREALK